MGDLSLKVWTSKEGQVRVYVNTRHLWHADECKAADGSYFYADETGLVQVWFPRSMSGEFGRAAFAVREHLKVEGVPFVEFHARIEAAQTKSGNFSAVRYFKSLAA